MRPSEAVGDNEAGLRKSAKGGRGEPAGGVAAEPAGTLQKFDLRELIADATGPLTAAAADKELAIQIRTPADLPRHVVGDADGIRSVLATLLESAVTFTECGEVVTSVTARAARGGRAIVHFEISDTGPGVPADALDGPAAAGLARSRKLVDRMDGRIDCATAAGLGSTMCFDVPVDLGDPR